MVNQEIIDKIKNRLKQGDANSQIYDALVQEGYNVNDINEAIIEVSNSIKKPIKILPIIIGVVILVLICGGLYFALNSNSKEEGVSEIVNTTSSNDFNLTDENGNNFGQMHINTDIDVEVSTDEGYEVFKQKFTNCQVATSEYKISDTLIYYLEILGPKDERCQVKSKFTANPNPNWINKEMTCEYDNSLDYETAVQDMSKCSGELYTLMTDMSSYN